VLFTFGQDLFKREVAEFAGAKEVRPITRIEVIINVLNPWLIFKGYPFGLSFVTENFGRTIYI
jgi:hypothetical protein